jgi:hypothetical protein
MSEIATKEPAARLFFFLTTTTTTTPYCRQFGVHPSIHAVMLSVLFLPRWRPRQSHSGGDWVRCRRPDADMTHTPLSLDETVSAPVHRLVALSPTYQHTA